jgi:hypothetical protein
VIRVKDVLYMTIVSRKFSEQEYMSELPQQIRWGDPLLAVKPCSEGQAERLRIAGQFANLFLMKSVHETTIGQFLDTHKEVLKKALGTRRFI